MYTTRKRKYIGPLHSQAFYIFSSGSDGELTTHTTDQSRGGPGGDWCGSTLLQKQNSFPSMHGNGVPQVVISWM